jgi:hypothetical protein
MARIPLTREGPTGTRARFFGDPKDWETIVYGGGMVDPAAFPRLDAVPVTVTGARAAAAVDVPVVALKNPIPKDATVVLAGTKLARLSAPAAKGATSLTVYGLPQALVGNEVGSYPGTGNVFIPEGTAVGRTYVEQAAGDPFGPAADGDEEIYYLSEPVENAEIDATANFARPHKMSVYSNLHPFFADYSATLKGKLRALYPHLIGA